MWKFQKKDYGFSGCSTWTHDDGVVVVWAGLVCEFEVSHPLMEDGDCVFVLGLDKLREVLKRDFALQINDSDLLKFFKCEKE